MAIEVKMADDIDDGHRRQRMSESKRKRAAARRRRTLRMRKASSSLTRVSVVAGIGSKVTVNTRTRVFVKRQNINILPTDKNVMIKQLVEAGSIKNLAEHFGVTRGAISSWFGRRGLQVMDVDPLDEDDEIAY